MSRTSARYAGLDAPVDLREPHDVRRGPHRDHFAVFVLALAGELADLVKRAAIDDARGAVYASTVNGGIHATGLGGKVEFSTVNGSIHASFAVIPASGKFSCKTVNGGIAITLPPDAGVQVQAGTVNGGIDCTAPLNPGSNVRRSHLSGTIGDGRATLRASTVNGGIRIEQR